MKKKQNKNQKLNIFQLDVLSKKAEKICNHKEEMFEKFGKKAFRIYLSKFSTNHPEVKAITLVLAYDFDVEKYVLANLELQVDKDYRDNVIKELNSLNIDSFDCAQNYNNDSPENQQDYYFGANCFINLLALKPIKTVDEQNLLRDYGQMKKLLNYDLLDNIFWEKFGADDSLQIIVTLTNGNVKFDYASFSMDFEDEENDMDDDFDEVPLKEYMN